MAEAVGCCAVISFTPLTPSCSIPNFDRAYKWLVLQMQGEQFAIFTFFGSALDPKQIETKDNVLLEPSIESLWDEIGRVGGGPSSRPETTYRTHESHDEKMIAVCFCASQLAFASASIIPPFLKLPRCFAIMKGMFPWYLVPVPSSRQL